MPTLFLVIKIATNLWGIVATVSVLARVFDKDDMKVLRDIRRPLRECTGPLDAGHNGLEELELWYFKVVDWSHRTKMKVKDDLLVCVEELKCAGDGIEIVVSQLLKLQKVP